VAQPTPKPTELPTDPRTHAHGVAQGLINQTNNGEYNANSAARAYRDYFASNGGQQADLDKARSETAKLSADDPRRRDLNALDGYASQPKDTSSQAGVKHLYHATVASEHAAYLTPKSPEQKAHYALADAADAAAHGLPNAGKLAGKVDTSLIHPMLKSYADSLKATPTPPAPKPAPVPKQKASKPVLTPLSAQDHRDQADVMYKAVKALPQGSTKGKWPLIEMNQLHGNLADAHDFIGAGNKSKAGAYLKAAQKKLRTIPADTVADKGPEYAKAHALAKQGVAQLKAALNPKSESPSTPKIETGAPKNFTPANAAQWKKIHDDAVSSIPALDKGLDSVMTGPAASRLRKAHTHLSKASTETGADQGHSLESAAHHLQSALAHGANVHPDLAAHYKTARESLSAQLKANTVGKVAAYESQLKPTKEQPKTSLGAHISTVAKLPDKVGENGDIHAGVSTALDAIGKLHGAPAHVKQIPILYKGGAAGNVANAAGVYFHATKHYPTGVITVKPKGGLHAAITAAHEMGHFVDRRFISPGQTGFSSHGKDGDPHMKAVMDAIRASDTHKELTGLKGQKHAPVTLKDGSAASSPVNGKYLDYMLSPHELFARAYAQHVANHSGSPAMIADVQKAANRTDTPYHSQWKDQEFKPIGDAMDRMMEAKGWKAKSK
jgi:hypothetical protein